jgi:hypothetical protein
MEKAAKVQSHRLARQSWTAPDASRSQAHASGWTLTLNNMKKTWLARRSQATGSRACNQRRLPRAPALIPAPAVNTFPLKRRKPEVAADATRRGNPDKATSSRTTPAAPARADTVQQKKRPLESTADGNGRNAQNKPYKAAMITTIPDASGSGTVSTDTRSSSSTGKKKLAALTAPPTTATAATSQSTQLQGEPPKPAKSTDS